MQKKKNIREQFIDMPVVVHLLAAMFVFCLLLFITLKSVDAYTHHNKVVIVPNIKGLQIEEAALFLTNKKLRYQITDSVFSRKVTPGTIVEINPPVGAKVKQGRIVSIILNAKDMEKAKIPDVTDLSFRQAQAQIRALGFTSVEVKYIPGQYQNLVIGIELNGTELTPGELAPLSSVLILKVSDGSLDPANAEESDTEPEDRL
jgi:beta-lactam-binding protein with PASTA domain